MTKGTVLPPPRTKLIDEIHPSDRVQFDSDSEHRWRIIGQKIIKPDGVVVIFSLQDKSGHRFRQVYQPHETVFMLPPGNGSSVFNPPPPAFRVTYEGWAFPW